MKQPIYILCCCAMLLFCQCKKDNEGFRMAYNRTISIPAGLNVFETHPFLITNIPADTAGYFGVNNVQSSQLKSITPYSLRLTSLESNGGLDFIYGVVVYIVNPDNPADYQEVFYRENIPSNEDEILDLLPSLPDIKKWINTDRFDISVEMIFRQPPPQFYDVRVEFSFEGNKN